MAQRRDYRMPPPVGPGVPPQNPNPGGYMGDDGRMEGMYNRPSNMGNRSGGATRTRRNRNCCDGWEHQMRGGQWMCGAYHGACDGDMHRSSHNTGGGHSTTSIISPLLPPQPYVPQPPVPFIMSQGGGYGGNQTLPIRPGNQNQQNQVMSQNQGAGGNQTLPIRPGNQNQDMSTRAYIPPFLPPSPFVPQPPPFIRGNQAPMYQCQRHEDCPVGMMCDPVTFECVGAGPGPMPPQGGGNNQVMSQGGRYGSGHQVLPIIPGNQNQQNQTMSAGNSMNPGHTVGPHFECNQLGTNYGAGWWSMCNNHPNCQVCYENTAFPPYSSSFCGAAGDCYGNGGIGPGPMPPPGGGGIGMPPQNPNNTGRMSYNRR